MKKTLFAFLLILLLGLPSGGEGLSRSSFERFATLALKCLQREYPNKLDHVMNSAAEVREPSALHPAFYGCFDWHSAVHGTWLVVSALKTFPEIDSGREIIRVLRENLSRDKIAAEVAYFSQENRATFERPYGWAWLLKLAAELRDWDCATGRELASNIAPLESLVIGKYTSYFDKLSYPIRTGVHPNSAFALSLLFDYARASGLTELLEYVRRKALSYYGNDTNSGAFLEPGGEDFFSPALLEADLMAKVMKKDDFAAWFERFFFGPDKSFNAANLLEPAFVSDRSDSKIVHLDGLNLSRSWCLSRIAAALPAGHRMKEELRKSARKLFQEATSHLESGDYGGEHWLASFALYALQALET